MMLVAAPPIAAAGRRCEIQAGQPIGGQTGVKSGPLTIPAVTSPGPRYWLPNIESKPRKVMNCLRSFRNSIYFLALCPLIWFDVWPGQAEWRHSPPALELSPSTIITTEGFIFCLMVSPHFKGLFLNVGAILILLLWMKSKKIPRKVRKLLSPKSADLK